MYGIAAHSTCQSSAATGAKARTPRSSIIAVAASGSRVRPSRTLPVPCSHAAANASRNAVSGTPRPYPRRSRGSARREGSSAAPSRRAPARARRSEGAPEPRRRRSGSPTAPHEDAEQRQDEQGQEDARDEESPFHVVHT